MVSSQQRNILLYYAFNFFVGLYLATGTTVLFERELGLSFTQIFTLDAVYMLMFILFEVPSGALADLIGRKKTIIAGLVVLVIGAIVTGNADGFFGLFLSFFIWAFGFSLLSGSSEALLYDTLKDEKLFHKVYGRALSFSVVGLALAGVIGPLLYNQYFRYPYFFSAVPFAMALLVIFFFHEADAPSKEFSVRNHWEQVKTGTKIAFSNRFILWSIGVLSMVMAVGYSFTSLYQPYLVEVGFKVTQFVYILPIMFVIEALGNAWSGKMTDWFGETASFWGNFLALGVSLIVLGVFAGMLVVPILFVYGLLQGFLRPLVSTYSNRYISSEHRATVVSVQAMFSTIATSGVLFMFGYLTDSIGVIALAGVMGALVLVLGSLLLWLKPGEVK